MQELHDANTVLGARACSHVRVREGHISHAAAWSSVRLALARFTKPSLALNVLATASGVHGPLKSRAEELEQGS